MDCSLHLCIVVAFCRRRRKQNDGCELECVEFVSFQPPMANPALSMHSLVDAADQLHFSLSRNGLLMLVLVSCKKIFCMRTKLCVHVELFSYLCYIRSLLSALNSLWFSSPSKLTLDLRLWHEESARQRFTFSPGWDEVEWDGFCSSFFLCFIVFIFSEIFFPLFCCE